MSEPARNRFALDLEDLERQLRSAGQAPKAGQGADPLAELTRIVGQDDPLKDIFAPKARVAPEPAQAAAAQPKLAWPPARREPAFAPQQAAPQPAAEEQHPPADLRGALDEFEALLRRTEPAPQQSLAAAPVRAPAYVPAPTYEPEPEYEPQAEAHPQSGQPYSGYAPASLAPRDLDEEAGRHVAPARQDEAYDQYQPEYPQHGAAAEPEDYPDLEPRRSRKGLWTAAALVALGVIGVGAAMTMRGGTTTADGQPPLIAADSSPVKIQPANPGGTEIPNQNKQIYERAGAGAAPTETKVVSREEQPVDVQQAARAMQPRIVMPGPGSTPQNGQAASDAVNALAAAPASPNPMASPAEPMLTAVPAVPGLGEPRRVRTVSIRPDGTVLPPGGNGNAGNGAALATAPASLTTGSTSAAQPPARPAAAPKAQERAAAPATTPVQTARAAPAEAPPAAAATSAIRAGTGDFTVQLGAPGSESEARATFAGLQRKYASLLGGQQPIVRRTELAGGKTVYRLRVGPYSREDATTMCTQLQAAGGQCFIAKN